MKNLLYALSLSLILLSCQKNQKNGVTYTPRVLTATEKFNESQPAADSVFTIYNYNSGNDKEVSGEEAFQVKFRDTAVSIQKNKANAASTDKFAFAQFVNTQKTALLVQAADSTGATTQFYLLALKGGKLDVVSLDRPSAGKQDATSVPGLSKVGRSGYLVNNDFFITNVNAQAYLIKRQNANERIQGEFILNSPDKSTLIFLSPNSLYQVHYPSDESFTEKLSKPAPQSAAAISDWIRENFTWEKNKKGITYLKFSDSDRIVDIREFS
ncbi:hypothetical protein [Pedobacter africanus]|uniref:hypothetical protein n=1 Tax=Pedobacter africanus TaxID=151894 RepID=UPI00286B0D6C|nr:hypothetical protein [Pedobacter africanus]